MKEKKIKVAGQPKINLKTFGEGKDLSYTLEVDSFPEFKLKPLDSLKSTEYKIKIEPKILVAANGYYYNGKLIERMSEVEIISKNLPTVEEIIIFDYVAGDNNRTSFTNFETTLIIFCNNVYYYW